jgi:hypothetical protein
MHQFILSYLCIFAASVRAFRLPVSPAIATSLRKPSTSRLTQLFGVNPKVAKRVRSSENDDDGEDTAAQLKALEEAANANKEEFEAMLKAKLDEWKELKAAGLLEKLATEELNAEVIEEVDELSKRLLRRKRGERKEGGTRNDNNSDTSVTAAELKAKTIFDIREKLTNVGSAKSGTSLGCFNLLNEMKDKEAFEVDIIESLLLAMTRLDSAQLAFSAIRTYLQWIKDGLVESSTPKFPTVFANACFSSGAVGLAEAGRKTMELLIAEGKAVEDDFLPGTV